MSRERREHARAAGIIEDLLDDPDLIFSEEGEEMIRQADRRTLRAVAAETLRGSISNVEFAVISALFDIVKVGKAKGDLAKMVSDPSERFETRGAAVSILLQHEPALGARLLRKLDPDERARLETFPFRFILKACLETPEASGSLVELLLEPEDVDLTRLFERLELVRKDMGIFPSAIYDDLVLEEEGLQEIRGSIVDVMIEERDPGAIHLFTRLLEESYDEEEQRCWRAAIMRLGTARAEHVPDSPPARAWMIPPEHLDSGGVAFLIENPDGTSTLTIHQLDPDFPEDPDGIRGGVVFQPPEDMVEALEEQVGGASSISPPLAASLIGQYCDAMGEKWFGDPDEAIMMRLLQAWRIRETEPLPRPQPASDLKKKDVADLFERAFYSNWMLDLSVVEDDELGELPLTKKPTKKWKKKVIELLDEEPFEREHIVRNLDFMGMFHAISGDQFSSSLVTRLAREIEKAESLGVAGLGEILLDQTLEHATELSRSFEDRLSSDEEWDDDWDEGFVAGELTPEMEAELLEAVLPAVDEQIRGDALPFVRATYERLVSRGMNSKDAKAAIAGVLSRQMHHMISTGTPFDPADYERDLAGL